MYFCLVLLSFVFCFGWNYVGQASQTVAQHYISARPMYVLFGVSGAGIGSVTPIMQQSENTMQSANAVSMTDQRRRLWVNIETALGECYEFAQSIQQTHWVLGQRRRRLIGIEQEWAAPLAQHWTGIWEVGLHPLYEVHRRQVLNECWPAPAMMVEEIHVEKYLSLSLWFDSFLNYILDTYDSGPCGRPIHSYV